MKTKYCHKIYYLHIIPYTNMKVIFQLKMYQNKDNELIMVTQCHYYAKVKKQKKN
jgi:hypothetical protein